MKKGIRTYEKSLEQKIAIALLAFIFVAISAMQQRFANNPFNGALQAFSIFLCIVMVMIDYKVGTIVADILMALSFLLSLRVVLVLHIFGPVPGLRNRRGLYRLLNRKTKEKAAFYVIYFDLDNFKFVNDNYGHRFGDKVLQIVAERMSQFVGKNDVLCRIGGDEFVMVVEDKGAVASLATKIIESVSQKILLESDGATVDIYLSAYAGISKFPEDSNSTEELIKYADIAMYEACQKKGERVNFFDKDMQKALVREMEVEKLVKEGLEKEKNIALLIIDLDYFKQINDSYGHDMGDRVLKRMAGILQDSFRSEDYMFRYGGDEFLMVMTEMDKSQKQIIGNKIDAINDELRSGQKGTMPKLSISVGVAFSENGYSKELFKNADEALYQVKEHGRCGYRFYDEL